MVFFEARHRSILRGQATMEREIQERSAKIQEVREAGPARNGSADGCSLDVCAYGIQLFKHQRYDMV